jgi:hypothetical protein
MQGEETTTSDFNIQQHQKYTSMNYGGQYTKQPAAWLMKKAQMKNCENPKIKLEEDRGNMKL